MPRHTIYMKFRNPLRNLIYYSEIQSDESEHRDGPGMIDNSKSGGWLLGGGGLKMSL